LLLTNRKEKEKQVIKLVAEEGKTTREISKEAHISSKDIGKIILKKLVMMSMKPLKKITRRTRKNKSD
jgi:DNA-directed RNA polymerase specialized sigma subunit